MALAFGPRRAVYIDLIEDQSRIGEPLNAEELKHFEDIDWPLPWRLSRSYERQKVGGQHPVPSASSSRDGEMTWMFLRTCQFRSQRCPIYPAWTDC